MMTAENGRHTTSSISIAMLGAGLWATWAIIVRPEWTAVLLLLSPFVLLPLGLGLAARTSAGPATPLLLRLSRLAPFLAIPAAASFQLEPGSAAAMLTIPWLGFTGVVAMAGLVRLLSRSRLITPDAGVDAGLGFLAVGGAWLTISRAGLNPLGFSDAIVQLTAVHFHYAGFALPIVAGVVGARLERSPAVSIAVIIGIPLTAAGITVGGWFEWIAATAMAAAGMAVALQLLHLGRRQGGAVRLLISTAGTSLLAGMSLAMGWAWSMRFAWNFLGLESMAATHGTLNALGFGLLGLIGLDLLEGKTVAHEAEPQTALDNGARQPAS